MANGILGKVVTTANALVQPYICPASGVQFATVFINLLNNSGSDAEVSIYVSTSATPAEYKMLMPKIDLAANGGTFEYPCLIVHPGERVLVISDKAGVIASVRGQEQT